MVARAFFRSTPLHCARELIGCRLQWGERSGIIVETEAYDAEGDEASHTFFRPSARAFLEAHDAGTAYVYFNYGVHWMFNVQVTGRRNGFVLIRALEPLDGIDAMREARGVEAVSQLCSGPGKLAKALGITGADHGRDLCSDPAHAFHRAMKLDVVVGPRIGITRSVDLPWRFHAAENPHVSGAKKRRTGRVLPRPVR